MLTHIEEDDDETKRNEKEESREHSIMFYIH